ncbi:AAA family ATPase [Nocardiopsis ansamitocini]|uniref:ATPase n=1 Tax=Nocardiopsis ansamitocini TaxID=1670832 RepID=A0A9W6UKF1_9ACTN|nr:AAA family ATPase [Nocardiopsis ansamitocini]GLU49894.1 ATPase [Nocardiopsis ansamitocini]
MTVAVQNGPRFVLTGGPGSGKTTLIEELRARGHAAAPEAGRGVIRDQMAVGGRALPWIDPPLFAELMLSWEMRSYREAAPRPEPVFFDRGVPDVVGYLRLLGLPVPEHITVAARDVRYAPQVFVAPPWPDIFTGDAERRQDLDEAERTHASMVRTYTDLGYRLVELPRTDVATRADFVLDRTLD